MEEEKFMVRQWKKRECFENSKNILVMDDKMNDKHCIFRQLFLEYFTNTDIENANREGKFIIDNFQIADFVQHLSFGSYCLKVLYI